MKLTDTLRDVDLQEAGGTAAGVGAVGVAADLVGRARGRLALVDVHGAGGSRPGTGAAAAPHAVARPPTPTLARAVAVVAVLVARAR